VHQNEGPAPHTPLTWKKQKEVLQSGIPLYCVLFAEKVVPLQRYENAADYRIGDGAFRRPHATKLQERPLQECHLPEWGHLPRWKLSMQPALGGI
jgi:hypothetical protein